MPKHSLKTTLIALVVPALALLCGPAQAGKTLDAIKARGQLVCGVSTGVAGFSQADSA
ncbi:MAG: aapJ, partial [Ramlibacter sp.]|nr:aapJ [Ramlibacter sp.]